MTEEANEAENVFENTMQSEESNEAEVEPQDSQQEQAPEVDEYSSESRARKDGWKPLDEYEGDRAKWRSAAEFNVRGEFIDKFRKQDEQIRGFDERLANVNELNRVQMENQKVDLEAKRDEAIGLADVTEANRLQGQIDGMNQPIVQPYQPIQMNPIVQEWIDSNNWINESTPKAIYAKNQQQLYRNQNMSDVQALTAMKSDLSREYPDRNQNVQKAATVEKGSSPGKQKQSSSVKLTYTKSELNIRASFPSWTDKQFEKCIRDQRGES